VPGIELVSPFVMWVSVTLRAWKNVPAIAFTHSPVGMTVLYPTAQELPGDKQPHPDGGETNHGTGWNLGVISEKPSPTPQDTLRPFWASGPPPAFLVDSALLRTLTVVWRARYSPTCF